MSNHRHATVHSHQPTAKPRLFTGALLLATALAAPLLGAESGETGIAFTGLEAALRQGASQKQVTVAYFTADWCGWCRKMRVTTYADPKVQTLARQFAWAKVDIDDQPHLAALFGVQGVPAMALLNVRGEPLEQRSGYMSPQALIKFLKSYEDKALAPGKNRQRLTKLVESTDRLKQITNVQEAREAIAQLIAMLAQPSAAGRDRATRNIVELGPRAWSGLVGCLLDQRLAVRAAAYDVLAESTGATLPFDPFADGPQRSKQIDAWIKWIAQKTPKDPSQDPPQNAPARAQLGTSLPNNQTTAP